MFDNAKVYDNARACKCVEIHGNAKIYGYVQIHENVKVYGSARVSDNAEVYGNAEIYGNVIVYGNAEIYDNAKVYGAAEVHGDAEVYGAAEVCGYAEVYDNAVINKGIIIGKVSMPYKDIFQHQCEKRVLTAILTEDNQIFYSIGCQENLTKEEFIDRIHNEDGRLKKNPHREEYLRLIPAIETYFNGE